MTELSELLREELLLIDSGYTSKIEILESLAEKALELDLVKDSYKNALLTREEQYPTGINTSGGAVAIPHAFQGHVKDEFLGIAILKRPVSFVSMENPKDEVPVEIVFLLGLINGSDQLKTLQKLVQLFQQPDLLSELKDSKNYEEVVKVLKD